MQLILVFLLLVAICCVCRPYTRSWTLQLLESTYIPEMQLLLCPLSLLKSDFAVRSDGRVRNQPPFPDSSHHSLQHFFHKPTKSKPVNHAMAYTCGERFSVLARFRLFCLSVRAERFAIIQAQQFNLNFWHCRATSSNVQICVPLRFSQHSTCCIPSSGAWQCGYCEQPPLRL